MPEGHADLFEVAVSQVAQNLGVDVILGEIAFRTALGRDPAAKPRHPSSFLAPPVFDDGLTETRCP